MGVNKRKIEIPLIVIGGVLVIVIYCICTFVSLALFPPPYSPLNNYLSDLGNSSYNPGGYIWFNIGCIITGLSMMIFFTGLNIWYGVDKKRKIIVILAQLVGLVDGFGLIMIGFYSEDMMTEHIWWSHFFFKTNLGVLGLISLFMTNLKGANQIIPIYGFVNLIFNIWLVGTSLASPLLEWITVFTALGFVFLITWNSYKYVNNKE